MRKIDSLANTSNNDIVNDDLFLNDDFEFDEELGFWNEDTERLEFGYDEDGLNIYGFDIFGINALTGDKYDINGFDEYGKHCITKTKYSPEGYDCDGYDKDGWFGPIRNGNVKCKKDSRIRTDLKQPTIDDLKKYEKMIPNSKGYRNYEYNYDWFHREFEENGKKGLKDAVGNILVPPIYDGFSEFYTYNSYCSWPIPACNSDGKYALVKKDGSGIPITNFEYDSIEIEPLSGWYITSKNGKKGIVLETGKVLLPCQYDDFTLFFYKDIIDILLDGKHGLLKFNGLYIEPIFDKIGRYKKGNEYLVYVQFKEKNGFLDQSGNFIEENICCNKDIQLLCYDDMDDFRDSLYN